MRTINVMLVDDHQVVCAGLKSMISAQPDLAVGAEASSGKHALEQLRTIPTDVLLLDLQLSDMSGLDVLRYVRSHYPATRILVISSYPESQFGLNVLRGGANGFISKGAESSELMRALRIVARGGRGVAVRNDRIDVADGARRARRAFRVRRARAREQLARFGRVLRTHQEATAVGGGIGARRRLRVVVR